MTDIDRLLADAQEWLETIPSGGIGPNGPTMAQLRDSAEETGNYWLDDATAEACQRAWRLIEAARAERAAEKEGGR